MVEFISVAAVAQNGVIGVSKHNEMPWRLGEYKADLFWNSMKDLNSFRRKDMQRFQELTVGLPVVMGKKTWYSIPEKFRPLADRINFVLSTSMKPEDGMVVSRSIDDVFGFFREQDYPVVAFMGGAGVYEAAMPFVSRLEITRIHKDMEGDVHFPTIDDRLWECTQRIPLYPGTEYESLFSFETWKRTA